MTGAVPRNPTMALGELRGLLAAFAWANHKCNHACTFTVEELPPAADIHQALVRYFGESAAKVAAVELGDWHQAVADALQRWLFLFGDLVKPKAVCALTDLQCQREMVSTVMDAFKAGLQPLAVWRVEVDPQGFYER